MKTFRFPKNIHVVNIPFLLHDYTPWQEQVKEQYTKFSKEYKLGKKHHLGFEITESGAMLVIIKDYLE